MLSTRAEDRARLVELEIQIRDLERVLTALRLEESAIKQRLDAYKYPVLTLPNEVVAEIFLHFLPRYPVCPPLTGPNSPILLTHICRLWREIALTTPQLWRAVSLSGRWSPFEANKIWVSRAGCCPLAIRMNGRDAHALNGTELIAAVLPYRTRCQYLELRLCHNADTLLTMEGEFPLLSHFDLEIDSFPARNIRFRDLDVPMLRSVVLDGWAAHWIILPWTQLTTLCLHGTTLEDYEPILRQASNLLECFLSIVDVDDDIEDSIIGLPITLAHLKSLKVDVESSVPKFLDSFILPALCSLEMDESLLGDATISSITSFIARSGCKLKHLCITYGDLDSDSYSLAFPSIQEVNVLFNPGPDRWPIHSLSYS
ncbi:F-box domain-containing protein [Favolaschia claudopus]|uniref:F-box domain-containing protein n=1 Tax=Favolaschia claudopus TaxID=2862362 RepID=A0AAW0CAV9_9AGAR